MASTTAMVEKGGENEGTSERIFESGTARRMAMRRCDSESALCIRALCATIGDAAMRFGICAVHPCDLRDEWRCGDAIRNLRCASVRSASASDERRPSALHSNEL
jgi:hypothetical protein